MDPPGDSVTVENLLARRRWLNALARCISQDAHRAEDAVQSTLVAAWTHAKGSTAKAWLRRVLRNCLAQSVRGDERRKERERHASEGRSAELSPHEILALAEEHERIARAVAELEEPYRQAVMLRFFEGCKPSEIALRMGVSVQTVHSRIDSALRQLRRALERRGDGRRSSAWTSAWMLVEQAGQRAHRAQRTGALGLKGAIVMSTQAKLVGAVAVLAAGTFLLQWSLGEAPKHPRVLDDSRKEVLLQAPAALDPSSAPANDDDRRALESEVAASPERPDPPKSPDRSSDTSAELSIRAVQERTGDAVREGWAGFATLAGDRVSGGLPLDDQGFARLPVPAGRPLHVWVSPSGENEDPSDPIDRLDREITPLENGESRELLLRLRHGADETFFGRVTVRGEGAGIPAALIDRLWGWAEREGEEIRADAGGHFQLAFPSWRTSLIEVTSPGYGVAFVVLRKGSWSREAPFVIELSRAAGLDVRLIDRSGRDPTSWTVLLSSSSRFMMQPRHSSAPDRRLRWEASCRADGLASFADLPSDAELALEVRDGDELIWRARSPLVLAPLEQRLLELIIGAGAVVHGRAVDPDRHAIAGSEVWLVPCRSRSQRSFALLEPDQIAAATHRAETDGEGRFEIRGVEPGLYWAGLAPDRSGEEDSFAPLARLVEIQAEDDVVEVELQSARGLFIAGFVRKEGEQSVDLGAAQVRAHPWEGEGSVSARVAEDGSFRVGPLLSGHYALRARYPGALDDSAEVQARAGDESVVLLIDQGESIAGRVLDSAGDPCDAHVHLILPGRGSYGTSTGSPKGSFRFAGLDPGSYSLVVNTSDGHIGVQAVELLEGERLDNVELVVEQGATLRIELLSERPSVRCAVIAQGTYIADFTLRRGSPALEFVPAGPLLIQLVEGAGSERVVFRERGLDVKAGDAIDLLFEL